PMFSVCAWAGIDSSTDTATRDARRVLTIIRLRAQVAKRLRPDKRFLFQTYALRGIVSAFRPRDSRRNHEDYSNDSGPRELRVCWDCGCARAADARTARGSRQGEVRKGARDVPPDRC